MPDIDWGPIVHNLTHIGIAYLLSLPVAWDRDRETRSAGLRTFPLVAVAACGYMLVGIQMFEPGDAQARALHGIITGMGFIGGGAILKTKGSVIGTATAASLWLGGGIGLAVAFGRYEIAILLSAINFLTLRYVKQLKKDPDEPE